MTNVAGWAGLILSITTCLMVFNAKILTVEDTSVKAGVEDEGEQAKRSAVEVVSEEDDSDSDKEFNQS